MTFDLTPFNCEFLFSLYLAALLNSDDGFLYAMLTWMVQPFRWQLLLHFKSLYSRIVIKSFNQRLSQSVLHELLSSSLHINSDFGLI